MIYEVPILTYHDIGQPRQYPGGDRSPAVFKDNFVWQIEYIVRHRYNVVSLEGLLSAQDHSTIDIRKTKEKLFNADSRRLHADARRYSDYNLRKSVFDLRESALNKISNVFTLVNNKWRRRIVLTFDDGSDNFYIDAYPLLRHYHLPATLFIVVDYIGQEGWLTEEQLKEIADNGITVGCHTKSHCYLPSLSENELKLQVIESKRLLENILQRTVNLFSYPNGGFTPAILDIVRKAGYTAAVTTNRSLGGRNDRYALRRIKMTNRSSKPYAMWAKLSGYYSWFKRKPVALNERIGQT